MSHTGRCLKTVVPMLAVLAAILLLPHVGMSAEEAVPPAQGEPAAAPSETAVDPGSESIGELIVKSGTTGLSFMAVLGVFSFVAASVAIERLFSTRRSSIIPAEFVGRLQGQLASGDAGVATIGAVCNESRSPISLILEAGVQRFGRPFQEVEKAMEDAAAREMSEIRSRIRPLGTIGAVAPLVGLLGTVLGMIIAFRTASTSGLGKGELMAQGIYMALLTTAAGLTIAIPCMLLSAWFNSRIDRFFREIDRIVMETMPVFIAAEHARGDVAPKAEKVGTPEEEPVAA